MKKLVLVLAMLTLSSCGFEIVDTGNRGIETRFGAVVGDTLPEGLHFYNPATGNIIEYSVRQENWSDKTSIFTKDTQNVDVEFTVIYNADPKYVGLLYKDIGSLEDLEAKIIKPVVLGSIKDSIGQINADELVSKREATRKSAYNEVSKNLLEKHVIVSDLQFTNLDFDDGYEKAVEEKVVATQQAQKAKNETVTITEEANQTVLKAKAQAESMRIQSEALSKNQGLVQYELAKKWDGKLPVYMMGNSVPLLDMKNMSK